MSDKPGSGVGSWRPRTVFVARQRESPVTSFGPLTPLPLTTMTSSPLSWYPVHGVTMVDWWYAPAAALFYVVGNQPSDSFAQRHLNARQKYLLECSHEQLWGSITAATAISHRLSISEPTKLELKMWNIADIKSTNYNNDIIWGKSWTLICITCWISNEDLTNTNAPKTF